MADVGVPASEALLAYVEANLNPGSELGVDETAARVVEAVGQDGLLEAAATIAAFCGLVRVADGTGIQLDDGVLGASEAVRKRTGINDYGGAANTELDTAHTGDTVGDVADLFA